MTASIPLLAGPALDAASWEQTPLVVRQLIVHLLTVIEQQELRIAKLEARLQQRSCNSDRPPSVDPPDKKRTARSSGRGTPGAKPGHLRRQAWLAPTEVIAVKPEGCSRSSRAAAKRPLRRWAGILVSDGYGVYRQWMNQRQTCMAHLLRRARGLFERKEPEAAWFGQIFSGSNGLTP